MNYEDNEFSMKAHIEELARQQEERERQAEIQSLHGLWAEPVRLDEDRNTA